MFARLHLLSTTFVSSLFVASVLIHIYGFTSPFGPFVFWVPCDFAGDLLGGVLDSATSHLDLGPLV